MLTSTGSGRQNPDMHVVIAGAGIAGLSAALYARLYGFQTTVYEELAPGGRCLETSHARFFPGLPEDVGALDVAERLEAQVRDRGAVFRNERVLQVRSNPGAPGDAGVIVTTEGGDLAADACIIAVGDGRRTAGIPEEDTYAGRGLSYCATCDGPLFRGKEVCVIGGGDSACDEALFLSRICSTVHLLCRSPELTALPALREEVSSCSTIQCHYSTEVVGFRGMTNDMGFTTLQAVRTRGADGESDLPVSAAFVFAGRRGLSASIAPDCTSDSDGRLATDARMRTSVTGVYAIGSARTNPVPQFVVAASDGVIAVRDMYERWHDKP